MTGVDTPDAPPSPYPEPERSHPRCPRHGNPLHWDGAVFRCHRIKRPNSGGHPVDLDTVTWGLPPQRSGGRPLKGNLYGIRLGEHEDAVREIAAERGTDLNTTVRALVADGLTTARRRRQRGTG